MDVQMLDGLPTQSALVHDHAKTPGRAIVAMLCRDAKQFAAHCRTRCGDESAQIGYVPHRQDQQMFRCLRIGIRDNDKVVVAIHFVCGNLTCDDLAKNACCGLHGYRADPAPGFKSSKLMIESGRGI